MDLTSPVSLLKGVGEKRRKSYERMDIRTVGDLLEHFPRGYIDLTGSLSVADAVEDAPCAIRAAVADKGMPRKIRKNLTVSRVRVTDMESDVLITFWNAKYSVDALEVGKEYIFYGMFERNLTGGTMTSPQIIPVDEAGLIPVYPLTEGLSSKVIAAQIKGALDLCGDLVPEFLPGWLLEEYGLIGRREAVRKIHFPASREELSEARRRLSFEELYVFALGMTLTRGKTRNVSGKPFARTDVSKFTESLGFELTGAQKRVVSECLSDMGRDVPMNRLIQGDVGSGKTAVAASLMYAAAENGFQSAIMAPTEVLAAQHAETLGRMFAPFGIGVGLLTGSMKASEKEEMKRRIADGTVTVVAGTHAIIQDDVEFKNLGLIVTDEQHRFGVRQRMALSRKGGAPHTAVMSATPIPRTLAFVLYGDLDISVLDEMPKNRLPVKTYLVGQELSPRVMNFVRKFAEEGRQSYIVCPLIEQGEETLPLESAADLCERLTGADLVGINVGLLHGKMKPGEKERVMEAFSEGRISVLVSTTVIEVGVDVPNAVCMVIENAERFGLSQLHQLRGRVGRGSEQSYCILISDTKSAETKKRLEVIAKTTDGFRIAEEDLRLRGPGDFFGTRQSGMPVMKVAEAGGDSRLLESAKKAVAETLDRDPLLSLPESKGLSERVEAMLAEAAM